MKRTLLPISPKLAGESNILVMKNGIWYPKELDHIFIKELHGLLCRWQPLPHVTGCEAHKLCNLINAGKDGIAALVFG